MTTVTCEVEPSYAAVAAAGVQAAKLYGKAVHEQSRLLFAGNRTGRRLGDGTTSSAWYKYLPLRHRRGRGGMQVFVRTLAGKSLALDVDPSDTVDEVKARIQARERVAAARQRLVFAGKHLDDGRRSLADYGVGKEANLHLLLRLRGGAAGGDSDTPTGGTRCWAWATAAGLLAIVVAVGSAVSCFPEAAAAASGGLGAALLLSLLAIAVAGVNLITAGVCLSGTAAADARLVAAQRASTRVLALFARRNLAVLAVSGASLAVTGVVDSAARPVLCFGFFALFLVAMSLTMACCSA